MRRLLFLLLTTLTLFTSPLLTNAQTTVGGTATIGVGAAPLISVNLAPPAATVAINATQNFVVSIVNDTTMAGANLSLACTGSCGTLSNTFVRNGNTVTYTAPSTANTTITLTITSAASSSVFTNVPLTVTGTTPPAVVNFVNTPAGQAAVSVNTFPITTTVGNSLIVGVEAATADTISTVQFCPTSGSCTTATQACTPAAVCSGSTTPGGTSYQYYAVNIPAGMTSIVVNNSSPSGTMDIYALDCSGLGSLDTAAVASNQTTATTTPTGPSLTPTSSGELLVAGISATGNVISVASPYTFNAIPGGDGVAYTSSTAIQPYSPSYTSTSGTWSGFQGAYNLGTTPVIVRVDVAPTSANVQVSATKQFAATVTNDSAHAGVTWTLTGGSCSGSTCGTLSSSTSASGISITYTAPSSVPGASVSRIQHPTTVLSGASGNLTITSSGSTHILCGIAIWNTAAGTLTVSDSASQTYTTAVTTGVQSGVSGGMACKANTTAGVTSLSFAVAGSSPTVMEVYGLEYAGVATSSPVDQATSAAGFTVMDSGSMSATTNANDVLIGFGFNGSSLTFTAGNDGQGDAYTLLNQQSSIGSAVEDFFTTGATNTYKATLVPATQAGSRMFVVALKASAAGSSNATLTATSVTDGSKTAAATISIGAAAILNVTVSPTSTSTIAGGSPVSITPTVANDPPNGGVTYTLSGVGTLSATSGPSGTPITYTPPSSVSSTQTVTVTVTAVDDPTKSATSTITVSSPGTSAQCTVSNCPAFTGALGTAQGGGAASLGGSGRGSTGTPQVFEITNLNDSGTGSLRACISASGPRFCIFRISGKMPQQSRNAVLNPYVYIAGQTAPGGPFTLGGIGQSGEGLDIQTHDVIVRYLSYDGYAVDGSGNPLTGPNNGTVGFEIALGGSTSAFNNIYDHISGRWVGNKFLMYANDSTGNTTIHDNTYQWMLYFEPNTAHPVGPLMSAIGFPSRDTNNDWHHNLFINLGHRIPLSDLQNWRWVSNQTYNYDYFAGNQPGSSSDYINNNWMSGNLNAGNVDPHPVNAVLGTGGGDGNCLANCDLPGTPSIYMHGNICAQGASGYTGIAIGTDYQCSASEGGQDPEGFPETGSPIPSGWQRSTPLATEKYPITQDSASSLPTLLPPTAGNWAHLACDGSILNNRDSQDSRVIAQFNARGPGGQFMQSGPYNGPSATPPNSTAPAIQNGLSNLCASTLHDGIYDAWKVKYGLSTTDTNLWKSVDPVTGYLYIEDFLDGIVP